MKASLLTLSVIALVGYAAAQYANPAGYTGVGLNPLTSSYSIYSSANRYPNIITNSFSGAASVLPSSTYVVTSQPGSQNVTTSANLTPTNAPVQPTASVGFPHTHVNDPAPVAVAPTPAPAPVAAPAAPAVDPNLAALTQSLTMPQIFSYLLGGYGPGIGNAFASQNTNTLVQCKTYCDSLPEAPVCDSALTLYRNECEAKCLSRTATTTNVRYNMCCCNDTDFDYTDHNPIVHATNANAGTNICLTTCIFNCMGGTNAIEAEHNDVTLDLTRNSGNQCNDIA